MKQSRAIFFLVALFFAAPGFSQQKVNDEGSKQAELTSEGKQPENVPEISSREDEGEGSGSSTVGAPDQKKSTDISPPGTITTSPSGNAGVIKDEHQTDGTSTALSAKPNIAGTKVPGSRVVPPRQKHTEKAKAGSTPKK